MINGRYAGLRDKVACGVGRRPHAIDCGSLEIMYYVYSLWSEKFGKIYVGMSKDPDIRLKEHNEGKSAYTKNYRPWILFYREEVENISVARKKEKYYKSGWGRRKLKSILEEWQSGRLRQS